MEEENGCCLSSTLKAYHLKQQNLRKILKFVSDPLVLQCIPLPLYFLQRSFSLGRGKKGTFLASHASKVNFLSNNLSLRNLRKYIFIVILCASFSLFILRCSLMRNNFIKMVVKIKRGCQNKRRRDI